jgi:hypothetical protein
LTGFLGVVLDLIEYRIISHSVSVSPDFSTPYNGLMITRALVLAMVSSITLVVTTPAFAHPDFNTAKPIPGYPDYEITDNGNLVYGGDVTVGKCDSTQDFAFLSKPMNKAAREACEAAGYPSSLSKTGGPPIILAPIALLVVCGLLIRKSTVP